MTRTVYVNGDYLPETEAKVSVFDRGFLMADGVYEVTSVLDGKLIDFAGHMPCGWRGRCGNWTWPARPDDELLAIHRELVARNGIVEGMIYLQVTRGNPGDRRLPVPARRPRPDAGDVHPERRTWPMPAAKKGIKVISIPDCAGAGGTSRRCSFCTPRWAR
jgi:D-alanine transaminase